MNRRPWQTSSMVVLLFGASVLLAGCPKKPAPAAGTGPGGAGPGAAGGMTGSGPGGPGSMGGAGGGPGAGGPGSMAPGGGGAMGTGPGGTLAPGGGPGGGPGGAGGSGSMAGGGPGSGPGSGPGGGPGGSPGAPGPGVAGATGTTIPALPSPKEFVETSALRDVHFDFDRYEIRSQDKGVLDENAKWLKSNANAFLLIEGHADERGTNEYNLALCERRAKATRDHLVSLGIDGGRITVISYGEERPLCTDRTDTCWAQNRRAHFLVKQ
jgi:peptidoglycan-associated lipoprotein